MKNAVAQKTRVREKARTSEKQDQLNSSAIFHRDFVFAPAQKNKLWNESKQLVFAVEETEQPSNNIDAARLHCDRMLTQNSYVHHSTG